MRRPFALLAWGIMAALAWAAVAQAQQEAGDFPPGAVAPRRISMGVGKSVIIDLPKEAAEVFVANPKVANALVRPPRKLYLIRQPGGHPGLQRAHRIYSGLRPGPKMAV
jgi:pilus assembly protein CpaC